MRIILLLATAVGAAGIGGAALAQSGAGFARQGAGSHGTAPPMARHDGLRGDRYFRPCLSEGFD
ncbi:MAG TPA: hypothetical protein VK403_01255, partial [Allosphingosinicella sp.]|nr:hypothetical protein [Allosphingosinicella sp.]